jgi:non-specific serine/threonine protein kinase
MLRNLGRAYLLQGDAERAQVLFFESMAAHQAEQNTLGIAECLIGLGSTAVVRGMPAAGTHLIAAAAAIREQRIGFTWPVRPMEIEPSLELARARLTQAEFQAEQAAGRAMSLDQAMRYAKKIPLKREATLIKDEKMDDLTEREQEVAALIARGKSNREIADQLVLSPRTVEKHVENILSKLGLTSRTQIVRWAMEQSPIQIPK